MVGVGDGIFNLQEYSFDGEIGVILLFHSCFVEGKVSWRNLGIRHKEVSKEVENGDISVANVRLFEGTNEDIVYGCE